MDEDALLKAHGVDERAFREGALTEDALMVAYHYIMTERHQCPGDDERGCGVSIPVTRERCHFCTKTIALRQEHRVIP